MQLSDLINTLLVAKKCQKLTTHSLFHLLKQRKLKCCEADQREAFTSISSCLTTDSRQHKVIEIRRCSGGMGRAVNSH